MRRTRPTSLSQLCPPLWIEYHVWNIQKAYWDIDSASLLIEEGNSFSMWFFFPIQCTRVSSGLVIIKPAVLSILMCYFFSWTQWTFYRISWFLQSSWAGLFYSYIFRNFVVKLKLVLRQNPLCTKSCKGHSFVDSPTRIAFTIDLSPGLDLCRFGIIRRYAVPKD